MAAVVIVWFWQCADDGDPLPPNEDGLPSVIPSERIELPEPEQSFIERHFTEVRVVPSGIGVVSNEETMAAVEAYVDSALAHAAAQADTTGATPTPRPVFPLVRGLSDKERVRGLGVSRSDGSYEYREADCEHPCEFGTRDTTMFFDHKRSLPEIKFGEYLWQCGSLAGLGAATAVAVDRSDVALEAAAVMGGGCVVGKVVF